MFLGMLKFLQKYHDRYIKLRNKVPQFYVSSEGKLYAKSEEVIKHPKVQKDFEELSKIGVLK